MIALFCELSGSSAGAFCFGAAGACGLTGMTSSTAFLNVSCRCGRTFSRTLLFRSGSLLWGCGGKLSCCLDGFFVFSLLIGYCGCSIIYLVTTFFSKL
jgi:hypothetical protein